MQLKSSILLLFCIICTWAITQVACADRNYYIQAENVLWDYAPQNTNVLYGRDFNSFENRFIDEVVSGGQNKTFGRKLWKVLLFEYTDSTFTTKKTRGADWEHLGSLGPIVRGVVGDTIYVTFKNTAEVPLSLHPHGVHYLKDSEGAPYNDGTSGDDKLDDYVQPGATHVFKWDAVERSGPQKNDPSSLVWLYHAHSNELSNTNLGAVGAIVITGKGEETSSTNLRPKDIDREIVIFMHNFDETASDYFDKNLDLYNINENDIYAEIVVSPYKRSTSGVRPRLLVNGRNIDGTFALAAQKATINGYLYSNYFKVGSTYRFDFNEGDRLRIYTINLGTYQEQFVDSVQGIGSVDGMHAFFMANQVLSGNVWHVGGDSNVATVSVLPASMQVADTTIRVPNDAATKSTWLMGCGMDFLHAAGMAALYQVTKSAKRAEEIAPRATVDYYLQIEEVYWDYAPQNKDLIENVAWTTGDNGFQMTQSSTTIGRIYKKAKFVGYTDATYTTKTAQPAHMGILGPAIKATVGDVIHVHVKNNATRSYSIFPTGVLYNKASEATPINDGIDGDGSIAPGETFEYVWNVPASAGPGPDDPSSIVHTYTSRHDWVRDVQAGLIGPIIIKRAGTSFPANERYVLVSMFDENYSPYINENTVEFTTRATPQAAADANALFPFTNWMFSLNGYMFGNMPSFTVAAQSTTRFYFLSVGKVDGGPHAIKFDSGITWLHTGTREDVVQLMPGMTRSFDVNPKLPGTWVVHCHTTVHASRGMAALLTVTGTQASLPGGTVREYFLQAEEVRWSYTSDTDYNNFAGRPLATGNDFDPMESWIIKPSTTWIGDPLLKGFFVGYTDDSFSTKIERGEDWEHLGILGPVIRANVGERIRITLRNKLSFPVSIFPQGLTYNYGINNDVAAGATKVYDWYVPAEAGPGPEDDSSIIWLYNSRVGGEAQGLNTGLLGPIIITAAGQAKSDTDLSPKGVDREFVILFSIMDESLSAYFDANKGVRTSLVQGSSSRANINGLMFGNLRGLNMNSGERVRFYVQTAGSFSSLHTFHTHGQTLVHQGEEVDVIELFPTGHATADMIPDEKGIWLLHCHYSTHLYQGMVAMYEVQGDSAAMLGVSLIALLVAQLFAL